MRNEVSLIWWPEVAVWNSHSRETWAVTPPPLPTRGHTHTHSETVKGVWLGRDTNPRECSFQFFPHFFYSCFNEMVSQLAVKNFGSKVNSSLQNKATFNLKSQISSFLPPPLHPLLLSLSPLSWPLTSVQTAWCSAESLVSAWYRTQSLELLFGVFFLWHFSLLPCRVAFILQHSKSLFFCLASCHQTSPSASFSPFSLHSHPAAPTRCLP